MKHFFCIALVLAGTIANGQILSFGVQKDSTGAVYFIRQVVISINDSTETRAISLRFNKPADAMKEVTEWLANVQRDSASLVRLFRDNTRHRAELREALAQLNAEQQKKKEPEKTEVIPPKETNPAAEIERLKKENEALRKQAGKQ